MKVAILGSRGIPNRYGGFEELAEKLAIGLAKKGHEVVVYTIHNHPEKYWAYPGIKIVRIFNPEVFIGSFGQFFYDLGAILHAHRYKPDALLQLGYTSSSIWFRLLPRKSRIITNMDGLEWKRSKYTPTVQKFLRFAERLAARHSHLLIADNTEIQHYLHQGYPNQVIYIPYGADIPRESDVEVLKQFNVRPKWYHLLVARMEPENHIAEILEGVSLSKGHETILVVGGLNKYARLLRARFKNDKRIQFVGAIYDKEVLNALRTNSWLYFHGHSVGGTNPSLLEAMACSCRIVAHNNPFNHAVLANRAKYFTRPEDIAAIIDHPEPEAYWERNVRRNLSAIRDTYNWRVIVDQYELALQQSLR
jgi:glycosyltransferase involved in cell wall biosynthesis